MADKLPRLTPEEEQEKFKNDAIQQEGTTPAAAQPTAEQAAVRASVVALMEATAKCLLLCSGSEVSSTEDPSEFSLVELPVALLDKLVPAVAALAAAVGIEQVETSETFREPMRRTQQLPSALQSAPPQRELGAAESATQEASSSAASSTQQLPSMLQSAPPGMEAPEAAAEEASPSAASSTQT
eukprot:EG_transcript_20751